MDHFLCRFSTFSEKNNENLSIRSLILLQNAPSTAASNSFGKVLRLLDLQTRFLKINMWHGRKTCIFFYMFERIVLSATGNL